MNNTKIVDKFLSNTGLIPNIFGRYSDKMIFSTEKEKAKNILFNVYWYKDIFDVVPQQVDEDQTINLIKVLNQYYDKPESSPEDRARNRL